MDSVPENFIDAFGEISLKHGMIRIELVSLSGPEPRVAQRLITSLQSFTQMLQAQNGMFEQLEKAGVVRAAGAGVSAAGSQSPGQAQASEAPPDAAADATKAG